MQIEPLNFSHQLMLENRFRQLDLLLSEYSFANLYLFRELHRYEVIKCNGEIFVKGVTRDGVSYLMPTSKPVTFSPQLLKSLQPYAQVLFPIPEHWLPSFDKNALEASFKEEDSDYLFATSKLAHFPGRHLSKKRNLVKQLFESHDVESVDLSNQLNDAQIVLEKWQKEHEEYPTETDFKQCQQAILNFEKLHLHGRIVYVDKQPAGFTIGDWITKDCYMIHFSKGMRSIKGLNQYLYQDLAQSVEGKCEWINLEQDLGMPALHDAKHSYLPDQLHKKWRVQIK